MDLKDFYGGVGRNAMTVLAAENDIQELYYAGENKSHMWWEEFVIRLTNAFEIIDKYAGREVHIDKSKMRLPNKNIRADFLTTMKTTIEMHMSSTPMTTTYSSVLANYRNTFNQTFPNEYTVKRNNIRIQTKYYHGGRRGRGGRGHQGRGGRSGRGGQFRGTVRRNDDW